MNRALNYQRHYLASQLLPILAKWKYIDIVKPFIPTFMPSDKHDPNSLANVAESLQYIQDKESLSLLKKLSTHKNTLVAHQAK
jgi:hypothetical protein